MSDPTPQTPSPPSSAAPDPAAKKPGDVVIDRLVFDIPGLGVEEAKALATGIGERLARAGLSGEHASVGITLGPVGGSQADLAARIAAALMERLV
jgi:hypothetical protein